MKILKYFLRYLLLLYSKKASLKREAEGKKGEKKKINKPNLIVTYLETFPPQKVVQVVRLPSKRSGTFHTDFTAWTGFKTANYLRLV